MNQLVLQPFESLRLAIAAYAKHLRKVIRDGCNDDNGPKLYRFEVAYVQEARAFRRSVHGSGICAKDLACIRKDLTDLHDAMTAFVNGIEDKTVTMTFSRSDPAEEMSSYYRRTSTVVTGLLTWLPTSVSSATAT